MMGDNNVSIASLTFPNYATVPPFPLQPKVGSGPRITELFLLRTDSVSDRLGLELCQFRGVHGWCWLRRSRGLRVACTLKRLSEFW